MPTARRPKCIICQSPGPPSSELYWHIGETTIRFFDVTPRIVIGVNNSGWVFSWDIDTCWLGELLRGNRRVVNRLNYIPSRVLDVEAARAVGMIVRLV